MIDRSECPFTLRRGPWRLEVWSTDDETIGIAELDVPTLGLMPMFEPPQPADRHDLAELEALALALSRCTGGAIHYARTLRLVLLAASGSSSRAAA